MIAQRDLLLVDDGQGVQVVDRSRDAPGAAGKTSEVELGIQAGKLLGVVLSIGSGDQAGEVTALYGEIGPRALGADEHGERPLARGHEQGQVQAAALPGAEAQQDVADDDVVLLLLPQFLGLEVVRGRRKCARHVVLQELLELHTAVFPVGLPGDRPAFDALVLDERIGQIDMHG